jgi:hypothetical protein
MQIIIKADIPKGEFPETMNKLDITDHIKGKIIGKLFSYISSNILKMLVCDHNTAEVKMKSIFIENADGFFEDVNTLLDDHGLSKKEFREKLVELINKN